MRASCALLETSLRHRAVGCPAPFFKGVSPPRGEVALAPEGADRQKAQSAQDKSFKKVPFLKDTSTGFGLCLFFSKNLLKSDLKSAIINCYITGNRENKERTSKMHIFDAHVHIYPDKIAEKASQHVGEFYNIKMNFDGKIGTMVKK